MRKSDRLDILFLQLVAVTSLVLCHAAPRQLDKLPSWFPFYIEHFYMRVPLFFFISGFLWALGERKRVGKTAYQVIRKKAKRLLLPYLFMGTVAFLPKVLLSAYTYHPMEASLSGYVSSFLFPATNAIRFLWFLPCLFSLFCLVVFYPRKWMEGPKIFGAYLIACLLHIVTEYIPVAFEDDPFCIIAAFNNFHYFVLGMMLYRYSDRIVSRRVSVALLIAFHVALFSRFFMPEQSSFLGVLNWSYYTLFIVVLYGVSVKIGDKVMPAPLLHGIGLYSYPIFIFSWFVLVALRIVLYDRYELSTMMINGAIAISFIAGLFIPLYLSKFLDRKLPVSLKPLVGL